MAATTALGEFGYYLAIGLSIGIAAIGTALAQSRIGASAAGMIAEDPDLFGKGLLLTVIPETMVLFGLIVALIMLFVA